jgi:hypothetical protein
MEKARGRVTEIREGYIPASIILHKNLTNALIYVSTNLFTL